FAGSVEYDAGGAARVRLRLIDAEQGNIIWSRMFDQAVAGDREAKETAIIRQVAPALVQPFGVIFADEARKSAEPNGRGRIDPRYLCLLRTIETFRSFDAEQHAGARSCLETLTAADPSFALGFSYLAAVRLREYLYGLGASTGGMPLLERALRDARRGVEL